MAGKARQARQARQGLAGLGTNRPKETTTRMGRNTVTPDREIIVEVAGELIDKALELVTEYPYDGHALERRTRIGTRHIVVTVAVSEPS